MSGLLKPPTSAFNKFDGGKRDIESLKDLSQNDLFVPYGCFIPMRIGAARLKWQFQAIGEGLCMATLGKYCM